MSALPDERQERALFAARGEPMGALDLDDLMDRIDRPRVVASPRLLLVANAIAAAAACFALLRALPGESTRGREASAMDDGDNMTHAPLEPPGLACRAASAAYTPSARVDHPLLSMEPNLCIDPVTRRGVGP